MCKTENRRSHSSIVVSISIILINCIAKCFLFGYSVMLLVLQAHWLVPGQYVRSWYWTYLA